MGHKLIAGIAIMGTMGCAEIQSVQKNKAADEARAWATDLGIHVDGVTCSTQDSDDDGYVSCAVRSGTDLHNVECRSAFALGHGCRSPKMQLRQQ